MGGARKPLLEPAQTGRCRRPSWPCKGLKVPVSHHIGVDACVDAHMCGCTHVGGVQRNGLRHIGVCMPKHAYA